MASMTATSFVDRLKELHQANDANEKRAAAILQRPDVDTVLRKKTQKMLQNTGKGIRIMLKKIQIEETQDESQLENYRNLVDIYAKSIEIIEIEYDRHKIRGKKL